MTDESNLRLAISDCLKRAKSANEIFELFRLLNYQDAVLFDTTYKRKKNTFDFKKEDAQRIKEIYSVLSFDDKLQAFLLETTALTPSLLRSIAATFDKQYLHYLLIFSVDYSEIAFVFPYREKFEAGKHKLKLTKLVVDPNNLHYTDVHTLASMRSAKEETWRDVWKKWSKAFSVERVTESFFEDYKDTFFMLRKALDTQKIPRKESHEFTLQFLNRLMFIYFISKKRWLKREKFMEWLWVSYKKSPRNGSNEFYENWLKQVFFKAFNNRSGEISGLPSDVTEIISDFPFLNGGLFRENELDTLKLIVDDKLFQKTFDFFEKYNFTIREEMALDQEVAVDPQMLGYVYESLANVAEEIYDRNDLGIFYTPRIEVDFMCRRSLVEYLHKHMADVPKDKFYHLVFDLPEERQKVELWFSKEKQWYKLEEVLDNVSVVDPACGSGAFLVGMLNVLADIYRVIYKNLKRQITDFNLKSRIIENSLYGVDVMPWAIHAAELRLWLQLIVETEFSHEELRKHSLLPNLNLNLRIGDSLVQEVGGLSFNVRTAKLKDSIKRKLDNLKDEKKKYFENSPTAKFKSPSEVKAEETRLFEEIIDERIKRLKDDVENLRAGLKNIGKQTSLYGDVVKDKSDELRDAKEAQITRNNEEIDKLAKIRKHLKDPEKRPFVWDIDFAEIFGEKNGFDIVIGNPPYVRQEMISPPNKVKSDVTVENRREYKEKLIDSVHTQFPVIEKLDKKSDYYVYFYFHGLSLLNEKGTFCFITSNSWLDVGYGKNLQEFLLKYVPVLAIYDNPKRSFAHADVNTIIALFGASEFKEESLMGFKVHDFKNWPMSNHSAKFVMFKKPFEEVISSRNMIEIDRINIESRGKNITEYVKSVVASQDYRVFPMVQEDLLDDGWGYPENYENGRFQAGSYEGNKWGGKYLRAPDIFYTILDKGKGKLSPLTKLAKIRFGIKTGVNEFFFLDGEAQRNWQIEKEFLKPVIKSPKDSETIFVDPEKLKFNIFMCNKSKLELKGTNALKYIEWGEKQKTENGTLWRNVPSVSGRGKWYDLGQREPCNLNFNYLINEYGTTFYGKIFVSNNFHEVHSKKDIDLFMNSTIFWFFQNVTGRSGYGGGVLKIEGFDLGQMFVLPLKKKYSREIYRRKAKSIFEELGINPVKPIREQEPNPLPDRAELDKIVFDELWLTKDERREVYWSVCELVKQRLDKAKSLKSQA